MTDPAFVTSPSPISGTVDNWRADATTITTLVRVSLEANAILTGLHVEAFGSWRAVFLQNLALPTDISGFTLTLNHDDGGSDEGNRFALANGFPVVLQPGGSVAVYHDGDINAWRLLTFTG